MTYQRIQLPHWGEKITLTSQGQLNVPDHPYILFIEGDGVGSDITPVMRKVVDASIEKAYGRKRSIAWVEIYAGEKATRVYGAGKELPQETLDAIREHRVAIKGPLTTPVGGGIRSLNVALRQQLDLYVCQRPVRYYPGTPSPLKDPAHTNMVIFRENSEDIYAGIKWQQGSPGSNQVLDFLIHTMGVNQIRFPKTTAVGIKPVSREGTERLVRKAIEYAIAQQNQIVTLVHKGNIMKYTEGAFRDWGYNLAKREFGAIELDGGPWLTLKNPNGGPDIIINDMIADAFLQQILLRPMDYEVIATLNLNGDYISDALAAQVGGIGISPGANFGDAIALFEATHGTAPRHADQDRVNPSSLILSAEMMLRYLGWTETADLIIQGLSSAIASKTVTYDLARLMDKANPVSCSGFGAAVIKTIRSVDNE